MRKSNPKPRAKLCIAVSKRTVKGTAGKKELAYQKTMAFRPKLNKKIRRNRRTSEALKWWVILDSNQ